MRKIAIINENKYAIDNVKELLSDFKKYKTDAQIIVFTKYNLDLDNNEYEIINIPEEKNNRPKMKNFVLKYFKEKGQDCFLHVIEDKIKLNENPNVFISDIENMMNVYDLNCWFDTVTDTCNYIFSKYNPRLDIVIDNPIYSNNLNISNAVFCSHSNVQWTIYNILKADDNELYFNENFSIDMFFIIEFLARRRNTHKGSLYFMNQYFTCQSEKGVFEIKKDIKSEDCDDINDKMKSEDSLFKSMNIDYSPDNNIDKVLETLYEKLNSKLPVRIS